MNELPTVRIQLDHMRETIVAGMSARHDELVAAVDRQLKEVIERFDYRSAVSKIAREVIEQEITDYFSVGQGHVIIKQAVQGALVSAMPSPREVTHSLYDDSFGHCKVCGAETLWGDAPHDPGCEILSLVRR